MPSEQILDTINIHKVPDLQTWKDNYQDISGKIRPGDLVSFPPSLLGEVLPTYPTSTGVTFLKATTTNSGTTTSWDTVDSFPSGGQAGDVLTSDGNNGVEWTDIATGNLIDLVTSISASSTDTQIPTAKAVWSARPSVPTASTTTPSMDGTASYGSGTSYARSNHVHPKDTSKADLASPAFTGTPTAPTATAGTNTTQIATTAFVKTGIDNAIAAKITYSTEDLTPGTSPLDTGVIYLVYEA